MAEKTREINNGESNKFEKGFRKMSIMFKVTRVLCLVIFSVKTFNFNELTITS